MSSPPPPSAPRFQSGDRIELVIQDLGEDDTCFGRLESGIGVFVKGLTAPGDRVAAVVKAAQKRLLHANLVEILAPGSPRIAPPCSHFGECGGCKWQQIPYEMELELKARRVRDALVHIGRIPDPLMLPILHADDPYGSRNKLQLDFTPVAGSPAPGFHRHGSFDQVVPITRCLHAPPALQSLLDTCRRFFAGRTEPVYDPVTRTGLLRRLTLRHSHHEGRLLVDVLTAAPADGLLRDLERHLETDPAGLPCAVSSTLKSPDAPERTHPVSGDPALVEKVGAFLYSIPPGGFFQVNREMTGPLVEAVMRLAAPVSGDRVFDLYCGSGLFSLPLADAAGRLAGFESHGGAVHLARGNAGRNGVSGASFHAADLSDTRAVVGLLKTAGFSPTLVVLDPPRTGVSPALVEWLVRARPERIVMVSCHPGSLARDLRALGEGGYRLVSCQPADLFPRTNHVESVSLLQR